MPLLPAFPQFLANFRQILRPYFLFLRVLYDYIFANTRNTFNRFFSQNEVIIAFKMRMKTRNELDEICTVR